ncbi:MAG: DUF4405 domain-containing protein [Candidatus Thiodiazotropha sp. (ex Monitilora ramsayi)]|nr:DUF4405 domain-containing protein [Candidatus Thiodiazotropha sp. (ex Monitilora ramsayi)]
MNRINTRKWSTPIIIGSGTFVAISGVLMFLGVHNPIELAHEWIGLAFAFAIILHILNHWPAFKNYFTQRHAVSIVGAVAIATSVFIGSSMTQAGSNLMMSMIRSYESSPLTEVAPLLDEPADGVMARFEAAGFTVEDTDMSIAQIATANNADPKALMRILFN